MIHALVVTHGGVARELLAVVESILGPGQGLEAMTNTAKSAQVLAEEVSDWCDAHLSGPTDGAVLFVDDMAGSCAVACRLIANRKRPVRVLSGVNLAMLLDFTTWRESLPIEELTRRLVEKGRQAIAILPHMSGED